MEKTAHPCPRIQVVISCPVGLDGGNNGGGLSPAQYVPGPVWPRRPQKAYQWEPQNVQYDMLYHIIRVINTQNAPRFLSWIALKGVCFV